MAHRIFVVNPGSTSTKVAMFDNDVCLFESTIRHDPDELKAFPTSSGQHQYRLSAVREIMRKECGNACDIYAFAGRGGLLRPLKGGTYRIDRQMLDDLASSRYGDHPCNLGAIIAAELAEENGREAYVVNPVVVDEMMDEARYTGLPGIVRKSAFHALNHKSAAMRAAAEAGVSYNEGRFIVAHLGGGISIGAHLNGRVVDVNNALEEGPFAPDRAGTLPAGQLVDLCFSGKYSKDEMKKFLSGKGGLYAYTGTTDCIKLENEAVKDEKIKKLLDAMIYRIAKDICACAAALYGHVDRVVITGGLARSSMIVEGIKKRVSFLAAVSVYPGEAEMSALAEGVLRVLKGEEEALRYGGGDSGDNQA